MLCCSVVGSANLGAALTDESRLALGVPLADGTPWDVALRRGGVLWAVMLPDVDAAARPDMLPNDGDPVWFTSHVHYTDRCKLA